MSKVNIMGVWIETIGRKEVLEKIKLWLHTDGRRQIVTVNAEFILEANHNEEFFHVLNTADMSLADGFGPKLAALLAGRNLPRVTGADLLPDILAIARQDNFKVLIVNRIDSLSDEKLIAETLTMKYPGLDFLIISIKRGERLEIIEEIKTFAPEIIVSALGAPEQDILVHHSFVKLPTLKLGIGVGGSIDFMTGKMKRAPKIMRLVGLEWLWRLILTPRRIRRIINAVVVFPLLFIRWKFFLPFFYRSNVVCILYKKESNKFKILLVERSAVPGHWQLPQGGTDGETLKEAGEREILEELGVKNLRFVAVFRRLWKYKFHTPGRELMPKRDMGYKGQKQGLYIAEFLGSDNDIKINYWDHRNWKWVKADEVINTVHPIRQPATKVFMEKFLNHISYNM